MNVYTIYDSTTEKFFGRLFLFQNDNHAKRIFKSAVTNADDPMGQHPDDYTLYQIGEYNDDTGMIDPMDIRRVAGGLELLNERKADIEKLKLLHEEIDKINGEGDHANYGGTN